ncbi:MAG: hypothetical protein OQL06_05455 [Gammaproteobacteria bacterium]|nr:hypothetical protein [Gammaproteobacteria bacterium]
MNRTFLIFLMIGTALMILVIGGEQSTKKSDYMPWNVSVARNGSISAFGITLNKTPIQDANQILASFPETRLISSATQPAQLIAFYSDVNMAGLMAEFELEYKLSKEKLAELQQTAEAVPGQDYFHLSNSVEMELLNTAVSRLTYKPLIDYDMDIILQRFGQPDSEYKISETTQALEYANLGLSIYINSAGQDMFVYSPIIKNIAPER